VTPHNSQSCHVIRRHCQVYEDLRAFLPCESSPCSSTHPHKKLPGIQRVSKPANSLWYTLKMYFSSGLVVQIKQTRWTRVENPHMVNLVAKKYLRMLTSLETHPLCREHTRHGVNTSKASSIACLHGQFSSEKTFQNVYQSRNASPLLGAYSAWMSAHKPHKAVVSRSAIASADHSHL